VVDDIVDTNSGTDILSDCCGKKKTIETELFDLDDFYSIFQSFKFGTLSLGMVKRHLSKMDIFFQRMVKKVGMA
jgi:hypothetical protein